MHIKKLLKSLYLWAVVLVIGAVLVLVFQKSLDASVLLLLAIVILCPIIMILMKNHKQ